MVAAPVLPEAESKAARSVGINVDHKASIRTPLVSADKVAEWDGDKQLSKSSRGCCIGPDGTAFRCLDARPTSEAGWWALFIANVVTYCVMIAVNGMAATGELWRGGSGLSVSEVSAL